MAEGIESAEQRELLRSFDCPHAQGYLFSPPQPARALASWLTEIGAGGRSTRGQAPPGALAAGALA